MTDTPVLTFPTEHPHPSPDKGGFPDSVQRLFSLIDSPPAVLSREDTVQVEEWVERLTELGQAHRRVLEGIQQLRKQASRQQGRTTAGAEEFTRRLYERAARAGEVQLQKESSTALWNHPRHIEPLASPLLDIAREGQKLIGAGGHCIASEMLMTLASAPRLSAELVRQILDQNPGDQTRVALGMNPSLDIEAGKIALTYLGGRGALLYGMAQNLDAPPELLEAVFVQVASQRERIDGKIHFLIVRELVQNPQTPPEVREDIHGSQRPPNSGPSYLSSR